MADELAIRLYGEQLAIVERHRGRPRLSYTRDERTPGLPTDLFATVARQLTQLLSAG